MDTLYLVSAMKKGISYCKVDITKHVNPLDRDRKHYLEVFRAEQTQDAHLVELAVARTFGWVMTGARQEGFAIVEPPAREGLSYDFPIEVPLEIYDWWLGLANASDSSPNPDYDPEWESLPALLDQRYPDSSYTRFDFCYKIIKNSPGLFDFSVPSSAYEQADLETLKVGFADWFGLGGAYLEDIEGFRTAARHWFGMARTLVPDLAHLCSFRPDRPSLKRSETPPMWG
jgi:hypothetical protein